MYLAVKNELRYQVVGIDYPETFQDLDERFSSDDVSLDYIAKLRWDVVSSFAEMKWS
jgi:hypothetical protein